MPIVLNLFLAAGTSNELWRYAPVVVELRLRVPGAALNVNGLLISGWLLKEGRDIVESGLEDVPSLSGEGMSPKGGSSGMRLELRYSFPSGLSSFSAL